MRRPISVFIFFVAIFAGAFAAPMAFAQANKQLAPLCTSATTPVDQQIAVCSKIISLKVLSGKQLSFIYFWRAFAWNKKANYDNVIADTTAALQLQPNGLIQSMRGSAYYRKGEYDIAISDFSEALRIGPVEGSIYGNRGMALLAKGESAKALADFTKAIEISSKDVYALYQERSGAKQALGDLDGAIADLNEAIQLSPSYTFARIGRCVVWRAKGEFDRAIADCTEGIALAKSKQPDDFMIAPGSELIAGYSERARAYEASGRFDLARQDYSSLLNVTAVEAFSKSTQAAARVRLDVLTEAPASRPVQKAESSGRRVALVIGNGAYQNFPALPNPPNDARAIAKSLRDLGYEVTEGIDLTQDKMQTMTRDFLRDAAQAKTLVLYYAGHGVQIDSRNYLVPVDVKPDAGVAITDSMTDMDKILAGLSDQVRTNILVFDACRNDPFAQSSSAGGRSLEIKTRSGLAQPAAPTAGTMLGAGTLIAFATAPGQVALDGEGANSPFSAALSRHIGTPGLEVQQMLTRVRAEVVAGTKSKQVPWSNSSLLGEVYLAAK